MPLGTDVGVDRNDIVFSGDPALPPPKKGTDHTQFLAHIYCGQTAGWIKMPLGTEIELGPDDVVLDGVLETQPPPKTGRSPSIFGP